MSYRRNGVMSRIAGIRYGFTCLLLLMFIVILVVSILNYSTLMSIAPKPEPTPAAANESESVHYEDDSEDISQDNRNTVSIARTTLETKNSSRHHLLNNSIHREKFSQVLRRQELLNEQELQGYLYSPGKTLDDLVMSKGGQPIRSVIVSHWRSGSTFLGDILESHPATFYSFEPLLRYGLTDTIREGPISQTALTLVKQILTCNRTEGITIRNILDLAVIYRENRRLWQQCANYPDLCFDTEYFNQFCRVFPFQAMKINRLSLSLAKYLLDDPELNLRIVYLVRDPRGMMLSRRNLVWCKFNSDCNDYRLACNDMVTDYEAAKSLHRKYKDRFRVVRYEDLSLDPYNVTSDLFQFFGLYVHPLVTKFLETHTKARSGDMYSTFRDSKANAFHWRNDLTFQEVKSIQKYCWKAMDMWGYIKADNETHQKSFMPIREWKCRN